MFLAHSRQLAKRLGVPMGRPVDVYLAPDEATFRSLQPGTIPDWADGTAWPTRGLVYLRSPRIRAGTASS